MATEQPHKVREGMDPIERPKEKDGHMGRPLELCNCSSVFEQTASC